MMRLGRFDRRFCTADVRLLGAAAAAELTGGLAEDDTLRLFMGTREGVYNKEETIQQLGLDKV